MHYSFYLFKGVMHDVELFNYMYGFYRPSFFAGELKAFYDSSNFQGIAQNSRTRFNNIRHFINFMPL